MIRIRGGETEQAEIGREGGLFVWEEGRSLVLASNPGFAVSHARKRAVKGGFRGVILH